MSYLITYTYTGFRACIQPLSQLVAQTFQTGRAIVDHLELKDFLLRFASISDRLAATHTLAPGAHTYASFQQQSLTNTASR